MKLIYKRKIIYLFIYLVVVFPGDLKFKTSVTGLVCSVCFLNLCLYYLSLGYCCAGPLLVFGSSSSLNALPPRVLCSGEFFSSLFPTLGCWTFSLLILSTSSGF